MSNMNIPLYASFVCTELIQTEKSHYRTLKIMQKVTRLIHKFLCDFDRFARFDDWLKCRKRL